MDKDKVLVYTTNQSFQADILKQILADNEIPCFLINKMDSSYLFGDIELYVMSKDTMRAKVLIEKFELS